MGIKKDVSINGQSHLNLLSESPVSKGFSEKRRISIGDNLFHRLLILKYSRNVVQYCQTSLACVLCALASSSLLQGCSSKDPAFWNITGKISQPTLHLVVAGDLQFIMEEAK